MVTPHHRPCLPALAALALALAVAACSSAPAKAPATHSATDFGTPPFVNALGEASLAECAIHRGLIPASVLNAKPGAAEWYHSGRVLANGHFATWWNLQQETMVKGKTLEQWGVLTTQHNKLPATLCGSTAVPTPSPST
jgi:hypothetical protein